jgi:hypothetical protein
MRVQFQREPELQEHSLITRASAQVAARPAALRILDVLASKGRIAMSLRPRAHVVTRKDRRLARDRLAAASVATSMSL